MRILLVQPFEAYHPYSVFAKALRAELEALGHVAVVSDQSAKVVNIKRLYAFGDNAAVSGLSGSEKVIVDGKQNLRPGGKVRVASADKPADGAKEKG